MLKYIIVWIWSWRASEKIQLSMNFMRYLIVQPTASVALVVVDQWPAISWKTTDLALLGVTCEFSGMRAILKIFHFSNLGLLWIYSAWLGCDRVCAPEHRDVLRIPMCTRVYSGSWFTRVCYAWVMQHTQSHSSARECTQVLLGASVWKCTALRTTKTNSDYWW